MSIQVGAKEMRDLSEIVSYLIYEDKGRLKNEIGFAILTFDLKTNNGMINYICNCEREDMIKALKEFIHKCEAHPEFPTPEEN